jgi:hypothetical protein
MVTNSRKKPLDPKAAGEFIGKPSRTLANWRSRNYGPAYVKVGHSVRYFEDDLLEFLEANRVQPNDNEAR